MKNNYQNQKDRAREKAVDIMYRLSDVAISYGEIATIQDYIYKLGKRYGLIKEFTENGII
ncbi:MAG: hypothetical protein KBS62_00215 [Oscillospiraceae bacterium]|nr:hypothetical protein [Candidatus Ruminococcus equi]